MIPWFCPKSVSTTRTEKTFPFNKDTTYLAPFLTSSISATSNWFYCFMSATYPLAGHYKLYSFVNSLANCFASFSSYIGFRLHLFPARISSIWRVSDSLDAGITISFYDCCLAHIKTGDLCCNIGASGTEFPFFIFGIICEWLYIP